MKLYFDMDGTIADFYGVTNWLEYLNTESVKPYIEAKPLLNMSIFARYVNMLQSHDVQIGIISWGSKYASNEYLERIEAAKLHWLKKHCRSIHWDSIDVIPYGTEKSLNHIENNESCILFDDEQKNRIQWENCGGEAYDVNRIIDILKALLMGL